MTGFTHSTHALANILVHFPFSQQEERSKSQVEKFQFQHFYALITRFGWDFRKEGDETRHTPESPENFQLKIKAICTKPEC